MKHWFVRHLPAWVIREVLIYAFAKATTGPWSHLSSSDVQFSTVYGCRQQATVTSHPRPSEPSS